MTFALYTQEHTKEHTHSMAVHAYNHGLRRREQEEKNFQDFEASLGYIKPYIKKNNKMS